jgi:hypothetical protein
MFFLSGFTVFFKNLFFFKKEKGSRLLLLNAKKPSCVAPLSRPRPRGLGGSAVLKQESEGGYWRKTCSS